MRSPKYWKTDENELMQRCVDLPLDQLQELLPRRTRKQILDKKLYLGHGYHSFITQKRATRTMNLSETEKAYIAGIIDGEGCVGVHKGKGNSLVPRVQIANTQMNLLTWLLERIGTGYIHRTEYTSNYYDVKPLLEATLPYLIIKKKQAELVLEFLNLRLSRDKWFDPFTQREIEIREELKKLNTKPCLTKRTPTHREVEEYLRIHEMKALGGE